MPELPEVEIHARNLRRWLEGERIAACEVVDAKLTAGMEPGALERALTGRRVQAVRRTGKYLLLDLDGGETVVVHLRMTGRFVRDDYVAGPAPRPTRLVLNLESGSRVRFEDRRRFGRVWVVDTANPGACSELAALGPDALLQPLSPEQLAEITRKTGRSIKTVLMDQRRIGGLGNIYAVEILFRAGVAPDAPANTLSNAQVREIARVTPECLEWAIGAQSRGELIYLGEKGAENVFDLYRRAGQPCPRCGTPIVRSVIGGRGTYYCPTCQQR